MKGEGQIWRTRKWMKMKAFSELFLMMVEGRVAAMMLFERF